MRSVLLFLNLLVSLASAVAAVIALIRPASLSGSSHVEGGEIFYVRMYAARSVPFGLTAAILPFLRRGKAVAAVLFTGAAIQTLDVIIAPENKERGMIIGGSVGAIVHLRVSKKWCKFEPFSTALLYLVFPFFASSIDASLM